jgi:hypothetical protein
VVALAIVPVYTITLPLFTLSCNLLYNGSQRQSHTREWGVGEVHDFEGRKLPLYTLALGLIPEEMTGYIALGSI